MTFHKFEHHFRLRAGGIECDEDGVRVGGVEVLARDEKGWRKCDTAERLLSELYGVPIDLSTKRNGFAAIARASIDAQRK